MLTKYVANLGGKKRTSCSIISEEGYALRELRLSKGFSMRQLALLIGKSDSYISHIENGRLDFPEGAALEKILTVFDGMKPKSFYERARKCRTRVHHEKFIIKWINEAGDDEVATIYELLSPSTLNSR